jgi:hypothetical protein
MLNDIHRLSINYSFKLVPFLLIFITVKLVGPPGFRYARGNTDSKMWCVSECGEVDACVSKCECGVFVFPANLYIVTP